MRKPHKTLILTVGAGIALLGASLALLGDTTNRDIEALKATGVPLSFQELAKVCLGSGQDAERSYEQFVEGQQKLTSSQRDLQFSLMRRRFFSDREAQQDANVANQVRPNLQPFLAAASQPCWNIGASNKSVATYSVLMSRSETLPYSLAEVDATNGNWKCALPILRALENFNLQVDQNPAYAPNRSSLKVYQIYEDLINRCSEDEQALKQIIATLSEKRPEPNRRFHLVRFMIGDVEMAEHPSRYVPANPTDSVLGKFSTSYLQPKKVRAFASKEIHMWRQAFDEFPKGPVSWIDARDELVRIYQANSMKSEDEEETLPSNVAAAIKQCSVWGQADAQRRAVLLAAKMHLIHHQTGSYPKSLPGTGDEIIDPFTQQPFVYRRTNLGSAYLMCGAQRIDLRPDYRSNAQSTTFVPAHASLFSSGR